VVYGAICCAVQLGETGPPRPESGSNVDERVSGGGRGPTVLISAQLEIVKFDKMIRWGFVRLCAHVKRQTMNACHQGHAS
jgi:hypothetical protein